MADYPRTRAFKLTVPMDEWLVAKAKQNHRKVGDVIRLLLLRLMELERDKELEIPLHGKI